MTVLTVFFFSVHIPGGGGTQQIFILGGSTQRSNLLPLLDTIFHEKGTPFIYLLLTNSWYPFHIPHLELCIPFNCCKCIVIYMGVNKKNRMFSRLYKAIIFIC